MNIRISDDIISRVVQNEEVILNLATGVYFGLNPTGTVIWQKLQENASIDSIANSICSSFDVSESDARKDALELITALEKSGLVQVEGELSTNG